jgi:hypothetical protein
MAGQVSSMNEAAVYDILIRDADGQHLQLESFQDLETARRRLPALAAEYLGTRVTLWNRSTREVLDETDGY